LKTRHIVRPFLMGVIFLTTTACSVFGVRSTPELEYTTLRQADYIELRQYPTLVVVSTLVKGSFSDTAKQAFRPLFQYISGDNTSESKISMTAPVISQQNAGQDIAMTAPVIGTQVGNMWEYQFVLPAQFTLENAPKPLNKNVILKEDSTNA